MSESTSNSGIFRRHIKKILIFTGVTVGGVLVIFLSLYFMMNLELLGTSGTGTEWRLLFGLVIGGTFVVVGIGGLVNVLRFRKLDF